MGRSKGFTDLGRSFGFDASTGAGDSGTGAGGVETEEDGQQDIFMKQELPQARRCAAKAAS